MSNPKQYAGKQIVHRIEDGTDRHEVACTTYQMRNFYRQLADGYFSRLDIFNYSSHHQVARWAAKRAGVELLDVCCGRGLLLPLLRYHAPKLGGYTGLDIEPRNATWQHKRVTTGQPVEADYYPFPTTFVEGNVADADEHLGERRFGMMVYTASIEHMHPDDGRRSLHALRRLAEPGCLLVLTCPNTPEGRDGYDTRYRAHVYEWSLAELRAGLHDAGWTVADEWGLDLNLTDLQAAMDARRLGPVLERLRKFLPPEWLAPALAPLFPEQAAEVGLLCTPRP